MPPKAYETPADLVQAAKDYGGDIRREQMSYITQTRSAGHCQEQLNGFISTHCIKRVQSTQTLTNVLQRITKQNTGDKHSELLELQQAARIDVGGIRRFNSIAHPIAPVYSQRWLF
ncbi:hypothetical protein PROFUN_14961 [Planoprotostelium fungivorum]|uniref:Uncharacterized protein n=1 Tax=Planoprotostelium fungivorum TaxID=1890364 RepID=A0A2P6MYB5_9EUKA|nr:hypothetical protein PROFUN_14961 [Planoprotostelium fungivorum]